MKIMGVESGVSRKNDIKNSWDDATEAEEVLKPGKGYGFVANSNEGKALDLSRVLILVWCQNWFY